MNSELVLNIVDLNIANRLVLLRLERNFDDTYLAGKLKVTESAYRHYEAARRRPSLESLIILSELYKVSLDDIVKSKPLGVSDSGKTASTTIIDDSEISYSYGNPKVRHWAYQELHFTPEVIFSIFCKVFQLDHDDAELLKEFVRFLNSRNKT